MSRFWCLLIILGAVSTETIQFPDGRIIGGQDADIESIPWQLSLQDSLGHICGACLIDANWALTAAHCLTEGYQGNLTVRAGTSIKNTGGQVIDVIENIINPIWGNGGFMDGDYALLKLAAPVTDAIAAVIPMAEADAVARDGAALLVSGWGLIVLDNSTGTDQLKSVEVPVISNEKCNEAYSRYGSIITDNMICAGLLDVGGKDSCTGDSGGPAVIDGVLYGVVSWGIGCADAGNPGVYASVPAARVWIKENSGL